MAAAVGELSMSILGKIKNILGALTDILLAGRELGLWKLKEKLNRKRRRR